MSLQNFLPLRREVRKHWVYQDNDYFKIWVEMLFTARFSEVPKKELYRGSLYTLNHGEFLFSRITWGERLSVKDHKIKKAIKLLNDDGMIEKIGRVGSSGATIFKIINYKKYNNYTENTPATDVLFTKVEGVSRQPQDSDKTATGQPQDSDAPLKKKENKANTDNNDKTKHINVFDHWNKTAPHKHKNLTDPIAEQLNKLTKAQADEVIIAINHYAKANNDNSHYYSHVWTLDKFIKQKNGYKDWLDDGQRWVEYKEVAKVPVKNDNNRFQNFEGELGKKSNEELVSMMKKKSDKRNEENGRN